MRTSLELPPLSLTGSTCVTLDPNAETMPLQPVPPLITMYAGALSSEGTCWPARGVAPEARISLERASGAVGKSKTEEPLLCNLESNTAKVAGDRSGKDVEVTQRL